MFVPCLCNMSRMFTYIFGLTPWSSTISRLFSPFLQHLGAMDTEQNLPPAPKDVRFRVLIIGRANAGKTSILQRVCDTNESPKIHGVGPSGDRNPVRLRSQWQFRSHHLSRFNSTLRWRLGRLILFFDG
jgi:hypothetical protein